MAHMEYAIDLEVVLKFSIHTILIHTHTYSLARTNFIALLGIYGMRLLNISSDQCRLCSPKLLLTFEIESNALLISVPFVS